MPMSILWRAVVISSMMCAVLTADTMRTQTIELSRGWNSVFLEVAPTEPSPADVFGGGAVDVVAAFLPATTTVQFLSDPGEKPWRKDGWGVWYAPERPEAMFSNLSTVFGNRPYLIHAKQNVTLSVTGRVAFSYVLWRANSFNYVGFGLDPAGPPTFADFFAGSKAHAAGRFYRLVDDRWQKVTSPNSTVMNPGEAYWVYCTGRSAFQGPVAVSLSGLSAINFGDNSDTTTISLLNAGTDPRTLRIDAIPADGLPLAWLESDVEEFRNTYPPLQSPTELPALEPETTARYRIHLRREKMTAAEGSVLLKLTTDNGQVHWIPLTAEKSQ